jgi:hypothetical protein
MAHKKDTPKATAEVIRAAMKAVAKDVRSPKVVRDKIVKPKKFSPTFVANPIANKKPAYIILDDSIRIKNKNIIDMSGFSKKTHWDKLFDFQVVVPTRVEYCSIDLEFLAKDKKAKKIMKLCTENKRVRMLVQFKQEKMVVAMGHITSFESLEGRFKFSYTPDYFEVR